MPGRLGPRFALEAGFLVALAVASALAGLRPEMIVLVMAIAWAVVALIEFTADRMNGPVPGWRRRVVVRAEPAENEEPSDAARRDVGSATVVAPPASVEDDVDAPAAHAEAVRTAEPDADEPGDEVPEPPEPVVQPAPEVVLPGEPDAADVEEPERELSEPVAPRPRRRWFWRRGEHAEERRGAAGGRPQTAPRHVRLLPPTRGRTRASEEVAEIFDQGDERGEGAR